ncbi:DUF3488 and transglutaminase-like domain-containing protein [Aestuariibacter sp. AA17]|uniref:DUF3488 and transglutaminase-like domain-containing protein n=1 Tax=Fluctibacter corallii TaxID=2984329 RepID=A0ABT3ADA8_9ALTE|nr:DUF3488 and transglutaminase-like domain-containing protein [Aestuariibacter sp. AA17]MCV2886653.1 DUF3488 and transglutaminase-like domain-containing protein [Aestuariibacter sp. AA17]
MYLKPKNNVAIVSIGLIFLLLIGVLLTHIQPWVAAVGTLALAARALLFRGIQTHLPNRFWTNVLALICIAALALTGIELGLLNAMLNLLVLACALKLLLLSTHRDFYHLTVSLLFLIGCGYIFKQDMLFAGIYSVFVLLVLFSLVNLHAPNLVQKQGFSTVVSLATLSIPIALILFITLPRLPALWKVPISSSAQTGLSDSLTPGDLSSLTQSDERVFRALFSGAVPPPEARYWRAIVLEDFDGKTWQRANFRKRVERQRLVSPFQFSPAVEGPYYTYDVLAEPSHQHWLYSLDVPQVIAPSSSAGNAKQVWVSHAYQLLKQQPLVSDFLYTLRAYYAAPLNSAPRNIDFRLNTQLPEQGNPRTRDWVASINAQFANKHARFEAILAHFTQSPFRYTLRPPLMPTNPVDAFLFDEQAGFCSHYASAAAYAFRLADIPARVVTGYQGGELRNESQLSVYQYDAHAWVEVWLDDRGWQRVDPTAIVAPDRITRGIIEALSEEGSFLSEQPFSLRRYQHNDLLNYIRHVFDDIDLLWSKWVLGFNDERQRSLLERLLGSLSAQKIALFTFGAFTLIAAILGWYFLPRHKRKNDDDIQRTYMTALALMENKFMPKAPHVTANKYLAMLRDTCPKDTYETFASITQIWHRQKYSGHPQPHTTAKHDIQRQLKALRQQVKK